VRLFPKSLSDVEYIDLEALPPDHFIACLMQLTVMAAAERNGELVADFETKRSGLRKPQVMRVTGLPPADEAGL
jgi:hypothetical protein